MGKPTFLNEHGVPIVGKRIYIPRNVIRHYRDGAHGVITRIGYVGGNDTPVYVYVKLERLGNPRLRLYAYDWHKCIEAYPTE